MFAVTDGRTAETAVTRHRALASPVRARMLAVLADEPELDAAALAQRLGLHVNTVRTHLNVLEEAGLVAARTEERDRPGRPRRLYRATGDSTAETVPTEHGYRFLSSVLASYLRATTADTADAAERAGRAWGSFVVDTPPPFTQTSASDGIQHLVAMLDEFGFDPKLEGAESTQPRLVLRRCPFLDVAREHPDVVCSVHLGLMRGALDELGVDVGAEDLIPWGAPDGCVSHLHVGATAK